MNTLHMKIGLAKPGKLNLPKYRKIKLPTSKAEPLQIGILADIHSNIEALRAAYDELTQRGVKYFICLGDIIGIGPHPEECVNFIQQIQDQIICCVRGNHEEYLIHEIPKYNHNLPEKGKLPQSILDLFTWNHSQLSQESINYIHTLPTEEYLKINGTTFYVSHYPSTTNGHYAQFYMVPTIEECRQIFHNKKAAICLFGHTHMRCVRISPRGKHYINPGSCGCPVGTDSAAVGIITLKGKHIEYSEVNAPYDAQLPISDMLSLNERLPAIDYTVQRFYTKNDFEED